MRIEYEKYRQLYTWHVSETDNGIFHVDSTMDSDDFISIISGTDNRIMSIANILEIDLYSIKGKEKYPKINYWFFGKKLFADMGFIPESNFTGTGSASISGIDYVIYNDKWNNHIQHIAHEEAHLLFNREVGEAPALLNEGLAVYTELMIYEKELFKLCADVWINYVSNNCGIISKLLLNENFWDNFGKLPLYRIGAGLVLYICKHYKIEKLKNIFLSTNYNDNHIVEVMELELHTSIDVLERNIEEYYNLVL